MRIIIVDDEVNALQTFLRDVIGRTDIQYMFFRDDEAEILEYAQNTRISAAFLDVAMPNIDGFSLAEKLIETNAAMKIVFVTGLSVSKKDLPKKVANSTLDILYKPYDSDELRRCLGEIEKGEKMLEVKTFGSFDCFINDTPVSFSSQKSKELFALLTVYNGKTLTMTDAISQLWPDVETDKAKSLYRDAVWRLRKTLQQINFPCVEFGRAKLSLNKDNVKCDYWDYLADDNAAMPENFLKSYDWSIDYLAK